MLQFISSVRLYKCISFGTVTFFCLSIGLSDFKDLIQEAEEKRFPTMDLLESLTSAVEEGEKCAALAQQLLNRRIRTR